MVCAVVLAAGRSERMGVQKLLLPFGRQTVIGHIVGQILRSAIARVVVVVGQKDASLIIEALADCRRTAGERLKIVGNPAPTGDMLSSVRCGVQALDEECTAVLVALGDQPAITSELIGQMLTASAGGNHSILVPVHGGKRGHPIVFAMRYREEVLTRYGEVGMRGLLQAHPQDVRELAVADPAVLTDMDWPEDYRRELARLEERGEPQIRLVTSKTDAPREGQGPTPGRPGT